MKTKIISRKKTFIPIAEPLLGKEELNYINTAVKSGWVSSKGQYIERFERAFADYCSVKYAVSATNGTAALHLALVSLGIGGGDEVIVPTLTFIATANAVTYVGAKPVFADSQVSTWCIDPEQIMRKITRKMRAIIVVHLYGHSADMDPIMDIAKKYHLYVIEDAAEAHGAEYKGKKVGSIGNVGIFSFYGNKIITTGEGGMLVTNNKKIAEKASLFKNHGVDPKRKYWHSVIGYNYRMTNLQAALGLAQLKKIETFIAKKQTIAATYNSIFKNVTGITLPPEANWARNVYWMYTILIEDEFGLKRDALISKLKKENIETRPMFYPVHLMPPYRLKERFPVAEELSSKGISLPSSVTLKKEEIKRIARIILKYHA